jgi:hypothetical protein
MLEEEGISEPVSLLKYMGFKLRWSGLDEVVVLNPYSS